jgi:hypothetical protein
MPEMTEKAKAALVILAEAVCAVLEDEELIYANPGERAIVQRLVGQLEGKYPDWSIGFEWDRREDVAKRLQYGVTKEDLLREGLIVPDIIIHRVGKRENLLVIEVKKSNNKDYERDVWKLAGMTVQAGEYGYAAGLHLVLDVPAGVALKCDVYVDGELDDELTAGLRELLP